MESEKDAKIRCKTRDDIKIGLGKKIKGPIRAHWKCAYNVFGQVLTVYSFYI